MELSKAHSSIGGGGGVGIGVGIGGGGSGSGSGSINGSGWGHGSGFGESNIIQVRPQRLNLKLRASEYLIQRNKQFYLIVFVL